MTREQVFEAYKQLQAKGVKHFGLHTMVVSNELDIDGLVGTAEICFNLAVEIKEKLGIDVEFIDLGGGVGVAYKPEQTPVDFEKFNKLVKDSFQYKRKNIRNNLKSYDLNKVESVLTKYGYSLSSRSEELSYEIFVELANTI